MKFKASGTDAQSHPYTGAVILAAGCGSRFSKEKTKQKFEILGKSVLERCLSAFDMTQCVDEIVVVCREDERDFVADIASRMKKRCVLALGGKTRSESARRGFLALSLCDTVLIHDAARCLITPEGIEKIASVAYTTGAATAAQELTDTVKVFDGKSIVSTVDRSTLLTVQTPQAFSYGLYREALNNSPDDEGITDDNMRVELLGKHVAPVFLGNENIKITRPEDIMLAEYILKARGES